jgi:hypothetical protein
MSPPHWNRSKNFPRYNLTVGEKWLPVLDYESLYEVSDLGRVRSMDRTVTTSRGERRYKGKILAPWIGRGGYPNVTLSRGGVQEHFLVHILVLTAHVSPCPPRQEARHGPRGKLDASATNLRWGTRSENVGADRVRDGQSNRGERHGIAVLTEKIVIDIRRREQDGERQVDIAARYGISKSLTWSVIHRKCWDWL